MLLMGQERCHFKLLMLDPSGAPKDDGWRSTPTGFVRCRVVCALTLRLFIHRGWASWMWARGLRSKLTLKRSTKMVLLRVKCANGMFGFFLSRDVHTQSSRAAIQLVLLSDQAENAFTEAGSQVKPLATRLNRRPSWIVGLDIPALEIVPHWFLCVIPNQHGLTMPMHALFSMQELELWKLTSQGMVLFLHTTWKMNHIVVILAALDLLHFITRTGKRTRWGLLMDGWNSIIRYYKNNFSDGFRQVYTSPLHTHPCFLSFLLMPRDLLFKMSLSLHAHVFLCAGLSVISHQLLEIH